MEELLNRVCRIAELSREQMKGTSRKYHIVAARVLFCEEASKKGFTAGDIGKVLGGRDHATIHHLLHYYKSTIYYENYRKRFDNPPIPAGYNYRDRPGCNPVGGCNP
ncbi:MAG: hypothetical protein LLG05_07840 [Porphyromonadaceae bacterium]|nr:hypothetical protein [Porphyromonadaceae bacterium]